jgi:hypothetical protein
MTNQIYPKISEPCTCEVECKHKNIEREMLDSSKRPLDGPPWRDICKDCKKQIAGGRNIWE